MGDLGMIEVDRYGTDQKLLQAIAGRLEAFIGSEGIRFSITHSEAELLYGCATGQIEPISSKGGQDGDMDQD